VEAFSPAPKKQGGVLQKAGTNYPIAGDRPPISWGDLSNVNDVKEGSATMTLQE
jgi:hypothetical protein